MPQHDYECTHSATTSATSSRRWKFRTAGNGSGGRWARWRSLAIVVFGLALVAEAAFANSGGAAGAGARSRETKTGRKRWRSSRSRSRSASWFPTRSGRIWKNGLIFTRRSGRPRNFCTNCSATDLLSPEQKESLGEFLESCDLVKFAKYEPGEPELRDLHGSAVRLVEETEPKRKSHSVSTRPRVHGTRKSNIVHRK